MKTGTDRLIVALDVSSQKRAIQLIEELDNVLFFKIGLELIVGGNVPELIQVLRDTRSEESRIFLDLKLSSDIWSTVQGFINACMIFNIAFVTVSNAETIAAAVLAREGHEYPKILGVPLLSDHPAINGTRYIVERGKAMVNEGADGLIVSGQLSIETCRDAFPTTLLVSPGIRHAWQRGDEHNRYTSPKLAIHYGADYLVVGRPIVGVGDKRRRIAADNIIKEIDAALTDKG